MPTPSPWAAAPLVLPSPDGAVHVFALDLALADDDVRQCAALLAADERERAARYRFERHRRRYVAGRAQLRQILGSYLDRSPADVAFRYEERGRPFLGGAERLRFNLSRSQDLALAAFLLDEEVGVDVECVRPFPEAGGIVERFFSPAERRTFAALPPDAIDAAFFRCWTRKEALLKSTGDGLSHPLNTFSVATEADAPPTALTLETERGSVTRWLLPVPSPHEGFVASAAVAGDACALTCWRWRVRNGRTGTARGRAAHVENDSQD